MKKLLFILSLVFVTQISFAAFAPAKVDSAKSAAVNMKNLTQEQQLSLMQQYSHMSVKDYEAMSGKKMNFLQRLKFKASQSAMRAELKRDSTNSGTSTNTLLLVILAILLPPLAVYLHENAFNSKFWISLILTLIFFIPGVIYALIVVLGK